ncbi:MAG: hydantoinase/oxoprolinase family protein [Thiohalomonadaceae bacterium]
MTSRLLLGVDTGGTFTDFVLFDGERLRVHKVLSTPEAPERAILQGIAELGLSDQLHRLQVVHGSTVATNAVLEAKGVRTSFITNRGFGDLLAIGRQARRALYDLQPAPPPLPVPAELCLEVPGRIGADGRTVEALDEQALDDLAARLAALAPRSVAINLLFSYLAPEFEQAIARRVPEGVFVSCSSQVLPEQGEYERGVATWLNAWVGPLVQGYLDRLRGALAHSQLSVMQSSGETVAAAQAGREAVRLLLSGPAGGLAGARFVAACAGRTRLLTFDMGGTSTDVALIDGAPRLTREGRIGPWPVAVPMVDMHTIGAGGGSIARVDAGGLLHVGPESAGASPGPACYGQGGRLPTVTDANLVLGRLRPEAFLGGRMRLDTEAARHALRPLAEALGCAVDEAAAGVVALANEHMAAALRVVSVQRGVDPRGLTLVSFGGAGGLHVCALADALGMRHALVPVEAGVLSALGMLAAPRGRQRSRTRLALLADLNDALVEEEFDALAREGMAELEAEGLAPSSIARQPSVDLRYHGQSYTLNVRWEGVERTLEAFHAAHRARFGHDLPRPVELVNLRLALHGPEPGLHLPPRAPRREARATARVPLWGQDDPVEVFAREQLTAGQVINGPALVTETVATTYVAPGWRAAVDAVGNLVLDAD